MESEGMTRAERIESSGANQFMKTLANLRSGIEHLKTAHAWISSPEFEEAKRESLLVAEMQGNRKEIAEIWRLAETFGESVRHIASVQTAPLDRILSGWQERKNALMSR